MTSLIFFPSRPGLITALDSYRITQVACGDAHSVAIDDNGTLFTWGDNSFGQLGVEDGKGDKIENKFFPTYVMCYEVTTLYVQCVVLKIKLYSVYVTSYMLCGG